MWCYTNRSVDNYCKSNKGYKQAMLVSTILESTRPETYLYIRKQRAPIFIDPYLIDSGQNPHINCIILSRFDGRFHQHGKVRMIVVYLKSTRCRSGCKPH